MNENPPITSDVIFEKLTPPRWFPKPQWKPKALAHPTDVGTSLLGASSATLVDFASARAAVPVGAPAVLLGVSELNLVRPIAQRLAHVQARVNATWPAPPLATVGMGAGGRGDPTECERAARLCANLAGVVTPLIGPLGELLEGRTTVKRSEGQAPGFKPAVVSYLLHARWFSELLGFDLDSPRLIASDQDALVVSFGVPFAARAPRRGRQFDPAAAILFRPDRYDAPHSLYGRLLRAVLCGELQLDEAALRRRIDESRAVPTRALANALGALATPTLLERYRRSLDEFSAYVDELVEARDDPGHPLSLYFLASA